jgi:inhibitor-of-growth protein 1
MQNVAAVEALYSATFMEDYLDCVENLPNDLQRHLSRLREFDLTQYTEFLRDLGSLVSAFEKETTASGQRSILAKIQHGLIAAQDIGDDKLATVQVKFDLFGRYLLKFNIIIQRYVSLVCLSL